ncbi:MutS-related protein [Ruminococcus albus]|uniref:MutS domain V n=1 Tax=Ruminococcus albus TaxID=1264 RepID=A0A1I1M891_RUMAL|nr:hypothetical protein [Ruminococcus albus]SFC77880.1 MutS domain V [Ruminococcus albus]
MEYLILISLMIVTAIVITIVQDKKRQKRILDYIRSSFGEPRDDTEEQFYRLGNIETLYLMDKKSIAEHEIVDDITWEDLSMDNIFALVNHTDSYIGEQCLYSKLHDLSKTESDLKQLEEKISFFGTNEDKRFEVREKLYFLGKSYVNYDMPILIENISKHKLKNSKFYYALSYLLMISIAAAIIIRKPVFIGMCIAVYLINMIIHTIKKEKMDIKVKSVFNLGKMLNTSFSLAELVPEFSNEISEDLNTLKSTAKRSTFLEQKNATDNKDEVSMMMSYLLGPLMIDFIMYDKIISELIEKKSECMRIYKFIGEIDCSVSIASYRKSAAIYCIPKTADNDSFSFVGLVHPAISNAIPNDIEYDRNIIITGSNASGKSTFIKSTAINLILGQTIHTCTSESASVPKCGVITSMAVRDDILSGESYYIREIKYLKRMIELCQEDRLLFLAIDEILKGTNTRERIAASKAILNYFTDKRCMLLVATHDLELAKAFDKIFANYYFSEVIDSDDIMFDYTLHNGINDSSNAIKLLSAIGFPDDIVDKAKEEIAKPDI